MRIPSEFSYCIISFGAVRAIIFCENKHEIMGTCLLLTDDAPSLARVWGSVRRERCDVLGAAFLWAALLLFWGIGYNV